MASRKEEKEAARARRLAEEQARAATAQRRRRMQIVGGVIAAAVVIVVVLVVVSSGDNGKSGTIKPNSVQAKSTAASVDKLLKGIPQHGTTLGDPQAPVTVTEYGDLECPVCQEFAVGAENQLISNEVRSGKVKLVYKSFETATGGVSDASTIFPLQQTAAYAAGQQDRAWNYIELFYHEQGSEGTSYVNTSYLTDLAKQVPGLDVKQWNTDRFSPTLAGQVTSEEEAATGLGVSATPTLVATGAKTHTQTKPVSGDLPYSDLQSMIKEVS